MFKAAVRAGVGWLGFELRRRRPDSDELSVLVRSLEHFGVDMVVDIGANAGQFGLAIRRAGYRGRIVSFEPLEGPYEALCDAAAGDPDWRVHQRCALGSSAGMVAMNVSANSVSSSALEVLPAHLNAADQSKVVSRATVQMDTLDNALAEYDLGGAKVFLKIDVQGYEVKVLEGATKTLRAARGLILESALSEHLYQGDALLIESLELVGALGFTVWNITPEFIENSTGRVLQVNVTAFKVDD